jgi:hypothetical protein
MQVLESQWLGRQLARVPDADLFPLLDIGSSTLEYRTQQQPYIQENLYAPLEKRAGKIWSADIKAAPGVDFTGDLLDPRFEAQLRALAVRSALVLNILQHVVDPPAFCSAVQRIVRPGGLVFLSGPHRYPRHFDPIDNRFRPDVSQVLAMFPGATPLESAIIDAGNWRQWNVHERGGRSVSRTLARACVPFYRPSKWLEVAVQVPYVIKHIKTWAVVLRLP